MGGCERRWGDDVSLTPHCENLACLLFLGQKFRVGLSVLSVVEGIANGDLMQEHTWKWIPHLKLGFEFQFDIHHSSCQSRSTQEYHD